MCAVELVSIEIISDLVQYSVLISAKMSKPLNTLCDMLETYGGRDKVMKALCYSAKLVAGLQAKKNPELAKKFGTFSSKISGARATLRLVDDFPMLQYSLEYGLGKSEPDRTMSILGVLANIVDHIYYPVEKICWLAEHNLINVQDPDKWDVINSVFWVMSIYLNLMRTLRNFAMMQEHKTCLNSASNSKENIEKILARQRMEIITIVRLTLDFTHAVSTLPKGWLWGGRLETWHVGLIGTTSAAIGIYQFIKKRSKH